MNKEMINNENDDKQISKIDKRTFGQFYTTNYIIINYIIYKHFHGYNNIYLNL